MASLGRSTCKKNDKYTRAEECYRERRRVSQENHICFVITNPISWDLLLGGENSSPTRVVPRTHSLPQGSHLRFHGLFTPLHWASLHHMKLGKTNHIQRHHQPLLLSPLFLLVWKNSPLLPIVHTGLETLSIIWKILKTKVIFHQSIWSQIVYAEYSLKIQ